MQKQKSDKIYMIYDKGEKMVFKREKATIQKKLNINLENNNNINYNSKINFKIII